MNICHVERVTHRVRCVLIFKCSHSASQMSTKCTWECICFFSTQAITLSLNIGCAKQSFFLLAQTQFLLHLFISFLCLSHLHSWISLDTVCSSNVSRRPSSSSPPAFTPWGSFTEVRAGLWKHSLCLLPQLDRPFILDNATATDEGNGECQSVSWCLCLHKHKIYWLDIKQMEGETMRHRNEELKQIQIWVFVFLLKREELLLCPKAWLFFFPATLTSLVRGFTLSYK